MEYTLGATKSNYFRVKDEDRFLFTIASCVTTDDDVEVMMKTDADGETLYAFSCYSQIIGLPNDGGVVTEDSMDDFLSELQDCVAVDDAIIMIEMGFGDMASMFAGAYIITCDDSDYIDLQDQATIFAADMLTLSGVK